MRGTVKACIAGLMLVVSSAGRSSDHVQPVSSSKASSMIPTDANLVVYRKHAEPTAWMPTVKIDGVKIAALPNKHFTATRVPPGQHIVTLIWPFMAGQKRAEMSFILLDGERQYFEITGISRVVGFGYGYMFVRRGSGIAQIKPDYAEKIIGECCQMKASAKSPAQ